MITNNVHMYFRSKTLGEIWNLSVKSVQNTKKGTKANKGICPWIPMPGKRRSEINDKKIQC
jgi:hypothetical protein